MAFDDYQQKLEKFISVVPQTKAATQINNITGTEYWGEVQSGTPALPRTAFKTQKEKDDYKKLVEAASVKNNETFTTLAGLTHRGLVDNWKTGGQLTSCNGFVGKAVNAMGGNGLGGFNVENILRGMNKSHCWITPASGLQPRFGDAFESRAPRAAGQSYENLHVGISLEIKDGKWHTIEGGQGGPRLGVDRVARVVKAYNVDHILGWVDMKLFVSKAPQLPDWLLGTWLIYSGSQIYTYKFDRYGNATQLAFNGLGSIPDSVPVRDTGTLTVFPGDKVKIRWLREGGFEEFTYDRWNSFPGIIERMNGVAANGSVMNGVRL